MAGGCSCVGRQKLQQVYAAGVAQGEVDDADHEEQTDDFANDSGKEPDGAKGNGRGAAADGPGIPVPPAGDCLPPQFAEGVGVDSGE